MKLLSATRRAPQRWRQSARAALVAASPRRWLAACGRPASRSVCLTFDDGPDPIGTTQVLDVLRAAGSRATFFVQGNNAAAHPDLIRRMHREGHAVGHHSWSHTDPSTTSAARLALETRDTVRLLQALTGERSRIFRPPHGKLTPAKLVRIWGMGHTAVLWSADPGDVFQTSPDAILGWFERNPPRAGEIVLMHDRAPALAASLPAIISLVRARGLTCSTVPEALGLVSRREGRHSR